MDLAATAQVAAIIEELAGDTAAAVALLREAVENCEEAGEKAYLSTAAAMLANALWREGDHEDKGNVVGARRARPALEELSAV
jgi:hypothetical protein